MLSLAARQQVIAEGVYYLVLVVFAYPSKQYGIFNSFRLQTDDSERGNRGKSYQNLIDLCVLV